MTETYRLYGSRKVTLSADEVEHADRSQGGYPDLDTGSETQQQIDTDWGLAPEPSSEQMSRLPRTNT